MRDRQPGKGGFIVSATQEEVDNEPDLIAFGLSAPLLRIAEHYIGAPISYRGCTVRRDIVGGPLAETRHWHLDNEDYRMLKIMVYLDDVDEACGPLMAIPKPYLPKPWRMPDGRLPDNEMERFCPSMRTWQFLPAVRGDLRFADTAAIWHRGCVPQTRDRKAVFFCYNSRWPRHPQYCTPLFDRQRFQDGQQLERWQEHALPY